MKRAFLVASLLIVGCGSPPAKHTTKDKPEDPGDLEVFPERVYTGYEVGGEVGFNVHAIQHNQKLDTEWASADETKAVVRGQPSGLAVIEGVTAGDTIVHVTAKGASAFDLPVTVIEYPADAHSAASIDYYTTYSCAECHDPEGAPDITSSGIAEHSDAEVLGAIVDGLNPEDGAAIESPNHAYALDEIASVNMLAFLRWQSAKTIPTHDH